MMASCSALPTPSRPSWQVYSNISSTGVSLKLSGARRPSAAVADAFASVVEGRQGNAFTNANKALAHIMAYGRDALDAPPPRLYAGSHLPRSILKAVMESLKHHGLLPERGYLENRR